MQRLLVGGMILVLLATPCFADDELSTLLQQRQRLQSDVMDVNAHIAAFAAENPLTTLAIIAASGGALVVIQDQIPQDSRNMAMGSMALGIAYCLRNWELCKTSVAYLTPLALQKISIEKTLEEVDARIAHLRASSSLPRIGQRRE
jgi:hypothetical protein